MRIKVQLMHSLSGFYFSICHTYSDWVAVEMSKGKISKRKMSKGKNIEREKCRKHIYGKDSSLFIIENLEIKETCFISYVNTNIDEKKMNE